MVSSTTRTVNTSSDENRLHLFHEARYLAERYGWCVLPTVDKRPLANWKQFQQERPDTARLKQLFSNSRVTGLGVVCGAVSNNLGILDFDAKTEYDLWAEENTAYASSFPTDKTPRGNHVYFRTASPICLQHGDAYDLIGEKGIVIIPPSRRTDGGLYEWLIEPCDEIPLLNSRLLERFPLNIRQPKPHNTAVSPQLLPRNNPTDINFAYFAKLDFGNLPSAKQHRGRILGWKLPSEVDIRALQCCPTRTGQRNGKILEYVRALKRLDLIWDQYRVYRAFQIWWQKAKGIVNTPDSGTSLRDFACAWRTCPDSAIHSLDVNRLANLAYRWLRDNSHTNTRILLGKARNGDTLQLLFAACNILQRNSDRFYLSGSDAGRLLRISKMQASEALNKLVRLGFLKRISTGNSITRTASYYQIVPQI